MTKWKRMETTAVLTMSDQVACFACMDDSFTKRIGYQTIKQQRADMEKTGDSAMLILNILVT